MTRIKEIKLVNIRAISNAHAANLSGNHILVSAPNECGKSTVLNFMTKAASLGRKDGPGEKVLKDGESIGEASYILDNGYKIKYSNKEGKEKLEIFSPDGSKVQKPKKEVLEMFRTIDFDVNRDFINQTPSKRRDAVCRLAGVDLSEYDAAVKVAEENRANASREVKHWQSHQRDYDQSMVGRKLVDVAAKSEQLTKKLEQQSTLDKAKATIKDLETESETIQGNIEQLQKQLKQMQEKLSVTTDRIVKGRSFVSKAKDQTDAIATLKQEIATASETNDSIKSANEAAAVNEKVANAEAEQEKAVDAVDAAKAQRVDIVREPIAKLGLSLGEDGTELMFTDSKGVVLPVDAANSATKVMIGAKIAINLIKSRELQVLPIDLSFLDKKRREELYNVANEASVQLFAEKHTDEGELTIITEEA